MALKVMADTTTAAVWPLALLDAYGGDVAAVDIVSMMLRVLPGGILGGYRLRIPYRLQGLSCKLYCY